MIQSLENISLGRSSKCINDHPIRPIVTLQRYCPYLRIEVDTRLLYPKSHHDASHIVSRNCSSARPVVQGGSRLNYLPLLLLLLLTKRIQSIRPIDIIHRPYHQCTFSSRSYLCWTQPCCCRNKMPLSERNVQSLVSDSHRLCSIVPSYLSIATIIVSFVHCIRPKWVWSHFVEMYNPIVHPRLERTMMSIVMS